MSKLTKALTAAAGNAGESLYVEDVFSTYLYTGTGSPLTITNGIDLDGKGGMVWGKSRTTNVFNHQLMDTERGIRKVIVSNTTDAEASNGDISAFNSDGFSLSTGNNLMLSNGQKFASWTFRKAEKFFDVVTYTGNGTAGRTVAHNLGSVPAVMIVKSTTNGAYGWRVYHQSLGNTDYLRLDETNAAAATAGMWNNTTPTDSEFTLGGASVTNGNGATFVAYLFASDAGGFGDDGSENIIKCGGVTTGNVSTDVEVDLGFEPQWILMKNAESVSQWFLVDTMRGWVSPTGVTNQAKPLFANLSNAESSGTNFVKPTATGFTVVSDNLGDSQDWIYIAIRRPMKTPESGTEVFATDTRGSTGDGKAPTYRSPFPVDMQFNRNRTYAGGNTQISARLAQANQMFTDLSSAESANAAMMFDYMNGVQTDTGTNTNQSAWMFKRATGFMDVVAYSGSGSATTQAHNLGVVPELMIVKTRSTAANWPVYSASIANTESLFLNFPDAKTAVAALYWNSTTPTASVFSLGANNATNGSGRTYLAYLFATLAGVSKVGSYTGTGSNINVDCGFSAGARFILIKRTDSSGDWYTYDSARGIVAGNDPYLLLNSTAAEVTNTDYIDPLSSGFTVTSSAPAALNASGGSYIFLAIA